MEETPEEFEITPKRRYGFFTPLLITGMLLYFFKILFPDNENLIYTIGILVFILLLFRESYTSKYGLFLKSLSLFLFINLIIFPYLYLYVLQQDKDSFTVETPLKSYIKKQENLRADADFESRYGINTLSILNKIIHSKDSSVLARRVDASKENMYKIDTFYLSPRPNYGKDNPDLIMLIYGSSGKNLAFLELPWPGERFDYNDFSLKDFLLANQKDIKLNYNNYANRKQDIEQDKLWDYLTILPYSFNIYSGNLKPQSKVANMLVATHWIIGISIFLGLLTSFVWDMIKTNKTQENINQNDGTD